MSPSEVSSEMLGREINRVVRDDAYAREYYGVSLDEYRAGIGAVLNTSFNRSTFTAIPRVCSAADAIDTFENSALPHLALGRFMISKKYHRRVAGRGSEARSVMIWAPALPRDAFCFMYRVAAASASTWWGVR